ncbi:MAG: phage tail tube protein [Polyangiaceae bacterium]
MMAPEEPGPSGFVSGAGSQQDAARCLAPIKDAVTADGEVVVPIDVEAFGFWLKATFGAPTTTGTTPKTHTFQSSNWTLPSMAIEVALPEVPRFAMYAGCVMDQLSWQMRRSGLLTATARLIAQGEAIAATTAAGAPTVLGLQRFGHFNGVVKRNGTALGNVVSADITYANGLDRIETIRNDGKIEGADPFPMRPVPFAPELPPAREVLSENRTLRGGGAAGAATVGAAGVEVLQDVLAETQSSIQPLVPYLDTLRWVLIPIALIGIAVTIHARLDDWKRGQR